MRALLQERNFQGKSGKGGKNTLYFGCKKRNMDYLYRSEIEGYLASKVLTSLHLAFSLEQQEKVTR
jgi:sulfite reductase alpha subunit-like flavoprotein